MAAPDTSWMGGKVDKRGTGVEYLLMTLDLGYWYQYSLKKVDAESRVGLPDNVPPLLLLVFRSYTHLLGQSLLPFTCSHNQDHWMLSPPQ